MEVRPEFMEPASCRGALPCRRDSNDRAVFLIGSTLLTLCRSFREQKPDDFLG